jgi:urease accessory protein
MQLIIEQKVGNINSIAVGDRVVDWLALEWYEANKRMMTKKTQLGREVSLRFLKENAALTQGDVLFEDAQCLIVVEILPCDCIVVKPVSMYEMASVCYEIGNKHLPLVYEENAVLVPYEAPLFRLLAALGYGVQQEKRKLLRLLKTTVAPHEHSSRNLFSKILHLTTPPPDA